MFFCYMKVDEPSNIHNRWMSTSLRKVQVCGPRAETGSELGALKKYTRRNTLFNDIPHIVYICIHIYIKMYVQIDYILSILIIFIFCIYIYIYLFKNECNSLYFPGFWMGPQRCVKVHKNQCWSQAVESCLTCDPYPLNPPTLPGDLINVRYNYGNPIMYLP